MAEKLHLEVVTPKGPVVAEDVDIVTAPGYEGEFGVLPEHAPLLSVIRVDSMSYIQDGVTHYLMLSGGFCEVSNNRVTFLAESAERGVEIASERALRAKERAEKRLAQAMQKEESMNVARAESALQRAIARLKVAESSKR